MSTNGTITIPAPEGIETDDAVIREYGNGWIFVGGRDDYDEKYGIYIHYRELDELLHALTSINERNKA